MSGADLNRRYSSLGFGAAYLVAAAVAGYNQELVWEAFAWDGISGQARHLVSILTTVFPHFVAIPGLALLIAGQRITRVVFMAIALVPAAYTIACLAIRLGNL